jgi:hypothetical protein
MRFVTPKESRQSWHRLRMRPACTVHECDHLGDENTQHNVATVCILSYIRSFLYISSQTRPYFTTIFKDQTRSWRITAGCSSSVQSRRRVNAAPETQCSPTLSPSTAPDFLGKPFGQTLQISASSRVRILFPRRPTAPRPVRHTNQCDPRSRPFFMGFHSYLTVISVILIEESAVTN